MLEHSGGADLWLIGTWRLSSDSLPCGETASSRPRAGEGGDPRLEADQLRFVSVTLVQSVRAQRGHLAQEASSGPGSLGRLLSPGHVNTRRGPLEHLYGLDSGASQ